MGPRAYSVVTKSWSNFFRSSHNFGQCVQLAVERRYSMVDVDTEIPALQVAD